MGKGKTSPHSSNIREILFLLNLLISDEWQRDEGKGQTRKDRAESEKWDGGGRGGGWAHVKTVEVDKMRECRKRGKSNPLFQTDFLLLLSGL